MAHVFTDHIPLPSANHQCQSTEEDSEHRPTLLSGFIFSLSTTGLLLPAVSESGQCHFKSSQIIGEENIFSNFTPTEIIFVVVALLIRSVCSVTDAQGR